MELNETLFLSNGYTKTVDTTYSSIYVIDSPDANEHLQIELHKQSRILHLIYIVDDNPDIKFDMTLLPSICGTVEQYNNILQNIGLSLFHIKNNMFVYFYTCCNGNIKQAEWRGDHLAVWIGKHAVTRLCELIPYKYFANNEIKCSLCYDGSLYIPEFEQILEYMEINPEGLEPKE